MTDVVEKKTCKAYEVREHVSGEEYCEIVFAHTRNDARSFGAALLDRDYMEVTAKRRPQFDRFAHAGKVPIDKLLEACWGFSCGGGCERTLYKVDIDEGQAIVINDRPYCKNCTEDGAE